MLWLKRFYAGAGPAVVGSGPWERNRDLMLLSLIFLVAGIVLLRQLFDSSLGYPDADRILMDGVFIRDFLKDFAFTAPYDYTINYYAQYPALSIGYRPPFFPFIEALFNLVFGVNTWSSRLALFAFAISGLTAFYYLLKGVFDRWVAFWASLVLITTPFVAQWGWYTMGEIPALSMVLITVFFFHKYMKTRTAWSAYAAALAFVLALWTKQTAAFMAIWFVLYAVAEGQTGSLLRSRHVWIAVGIATVLVLPLVAVTIWLGDLNLMQSIGNEEVLASRPGRLSWENLRILWKHLYGSHLTAVVLFSSIVGAGWAAFRRDRRTVMFFLIIVSVYVFFSFIVGKNVRYPIFWIPAYAVLAVLPFHYAMSVTRGAAKRYVFVGCGLAVGAVVAYQMLLIQKQVPRHATGYDEAAAYAVEHSASPAIFVDAYNNGYFTYFVRAMDPTRSKYVLRGDKLLTSAAIGQRRWLKEHATSAPEIKAIFDKYGISLIVVEEFDYTGLPAHQILREYLKGEKFRLLKSIPIDGNRAAALGSIYVPLGESSLLIYEYLDARRPEGDELILELPIVGKTIRVPYGRAKTP